jgi:hypothetical protein
LSVTCSRIVTFGMVQFGGLAASRQAASKHAREMGLHLYYVHSLSLIRRSKGRAADLNIDVRATAADAFVSMPRESARRYSPYAIALSAQPRMSHWQPPAAQPVERRSATGAPQIRWRLVHCLESARGSKREPLYRQRCSGSSGSASPHSGVGAIAPGRMVTSCLREDQSPAQRPNLRGGRWSRPVIQSAARITAHRPRGGSLPKGGRLTRQTKWAGRWRTLASSSV